MSSLGLNLSPRMEHSLHLRIAPKMIQSMEILQLTVAALEEKILQEKETDEPISGLLIFPMEPKQKAKDLELTYAGPGSKLTVRFR